MATINRKAKVAANVRAYYARAEYVTPRVALDREHARALRDFMKHSGLGVSDAIRAAIRAVAGKRKVASKPPKSKNHPPVARGGTSATGGRVATLHSPARPAQRMRTASRRRPRQ